MSAFDELFEFCAKHDLADDDDARDRWRGYLELLESFNARANLIGPLSADEIVRSLFIDSVACAVVSRPFGRVLDVGSGAGLPGIPLKIAVPQIHLTMVEPRRKRSEFLRICRHRLKLEDVDVVAERIEDVPDALYDWVVSKAFRPPPQWLEIAAAMTAPGGRIVCMHASDATQPLSDCAARIGCERVAHVADVMGDLGVAVPPDRSISVFAPE